MERMVPVATAMIAAAAGVILLGLFFWPSPKPAPPNPVPKQSPTPPGAKSAASPPQEQNPNVDQVIADQIETPSTAPGLFAAIPKLPIQTIRQYLPQALDICTDEEFLHAEKVYFDTAMPRFVAESIFEDALNRPDSIKLPFLAKTALAPAHPMAPQSREILEVYLQLAPGTTPNVPWDAAVKRYLEENP